MRFAEFVLRRAPNFVSIVPVGLMEVGAGLRGTVDILPEIDFQVDF